MNGEGPTALDGRIATVLRVGTWLASCAIAIGLLLPSGAPVVTTGIGMFVALPIVRVTVMLIEFIRHRDYRIGIISALVLVVLVLGIALGLHTKAAGG